MSDSRVWIHSLLLTCTFALGFITPARSITVYTKLGAGDPSAPGSIIEVEVHVRDNAVHRVGAYSLVLVWPTDALSLDSALAGADFPASPVAFVPQAGQVRLVSFTGDSLSFFRNGHLATIKFRTKQAVAVSSYTIVLDAYGGFGLFTAYPGRPLVVSEYDFAGTTSLSSGVHLPLGTPLQPFDLVGDLDGDGLQSPPEVRLPNGSSSSSALRDTDGDGLDDNVEDANGNSVQDGGETNALNRDSDSDGVEDGVEVNVLNSDPLDNGSPGVYTDEDVDGLPAFVDPDDHNPDTDGDRFRDGYEAALLGLESITTAEARPSLGDVNDDGNIVPSTDGLVVQFHWADTVTAGFFLVTRKGIRADVNRDMRIDVADAKEIFNFAIHSGPPPIWPADGTDTDIDGIIDGRESDKVYSFSGKTNRYLTDSDGDGLIDGKEGTSGVGVQVLSYPSGRNRDSDGDGALDGIEVRYLGSDPLNAASPGGIVDADGDELPAAIDPDDNNSDVDGDRIRDGYEAALFNLAAVQNANDGPRLGDVNLADGVSNVDALITQSMFIGLTPPTQFEGTTYADTNRDGSISNVDALIMQSYFLGILPRLPL